MIKNVVRRNEIIDPNILIAKLKKENENLKAELENFNGFKKKEFLTEEEKIQCKNFVIKF